MFELKVVTHFAAAHRLKMVGNKCENLHGHNWKVEVCVSGSKLTDAGLLIDFGELKSHVATVIDELDHRFLNDLDCFDNGNPSSENIATYIAGRVDRLLTSTNARISRVAVWESENACATYIPD
ncbi:MAG: 6-carboxytetrahydropterin synthase QueD [Thermodesulfobacteriota bacterium]|nr:6-carboxytetrahydropterin synthase QueD [Thermodesulfobacteriota bacterium]